MPTAVRSMSRSKGRRTRARADAVELARHHAAHVGRPGRAVHAALPAGALRPARPRQVGRAERPYTMERLGRDVLAVLDGLGIKKVNWCGLSMGGMVGMWLGANAPERVRAARPLQHVELFPRQERLERPPQAGAREGRRGVRRAQHGALVHQGLSRARPAGDRAQSRRCSPRRRSKAISAAARRCATWTTASCCRRSRRRRSVIAGRHDGATTPEAGEYIAKHIPGAQYMTLDAAHLSNIEQPQAYTDAVLSFC